jgi:hypothetical protein
MSDELPIESNRSRITDLLSRWTMKNTKDFVATQNEIMKQDGFPVIEELEDKNPYAETQTVSHPVIFGCQVHTTLSCAEEPIKST